MQPPGLNFQQAPPISVPFRFFLTAPVFALLASVVMLCNGEEMLASRWSSATLAVVHLLTLGFMTMVMAGAMMQMLPVLAGTPVPKPRIVAMVVHPALMVGTLMFAGGLLFAQPMLLKVAIPILGVGLAVFVVVVLFVLSRARNPTSTVLAMGLATVALGVTLLLGLGLSASRAWGVALPSQSLQDIHPAWALLGWTGLLVVGVAYHIVPMFQMTDSYPHWLIRGFAPMIFMVLALWSIVNWKIAGAQSQWWLSLIGICVLAGAYSTFAGITLNLQRHRRRRLPDVTLEFWRIGMISVALAALLWLSQNFPVLSFQQSGMLLGVLMLVGATMSFISGMLCKIVPFLAWFHLQARLGAGGALPNVKAMLPDKAQRLQLRLHLVALALCVAAALLPSVFAYPAALGFGAASLSVLWNMISVVRIYRNFAAGGSPAT